MMFYPPADDLLFVGLHGLPRVGKTTLARLIAADHNLGVVGFADALYEEVAAAFGVKVSELQSAEWKEEGQKRLQPWLCYDEEFFALTELRRIPRTAYLTSRQALQLWGTEYRRAQDNEYWLKHVTTRILAHRVQGRSGAVLHDIRFPNEAHYLQRVTPPYAKVRLLEIRRNEIPQPNGHVSNAGLNPCWITHTFHNNGTIDELHQQVKAATGL